MHSASRRADRAKSPHNVPRAIAPRSVPRSGKTNAKALIDKALIDKAQIGKAQIGRVPIVNARCDRNRPARRSVRNHRAIRAPVAAIVPVSRASAM